MKGVFNLLGVMLLLGYGYLTSGESYPPVISTAITVDGEIPGAGSITFSCTATANPAEISKFTWLYHGYDVLEQIPDIFEAMDPTASSVKMLEVTEDDLGNIINCLTHNSVGGSVASITIPDCNPKCSSNLKEGHVYREGDEASISCMTECGVPISSLRWDIDGSFLENAEVYADGSNIYSNYNWSLGPEHDGSTFACFASQSYLLENRMCSLSQLQVEYPPVIITDMSIEGNIPGSGSITFTCEVTTANPAHISDFTWSYKDQSALEDLADQFKALDSSASMVKMVEIAEIDFGSTITCSVSNSVGKRSVTINLPSGFNIISNLQWVLNISIFFACCFLFAIICYVIRHSVTCFKVYRDYISKRNHAEDNNSHSGHGIAQDAIAEVFGSNRSGPPPLPSLVASSFDGESNPSFEFERENEASSSRPGPESVGTGPLDSDTIFSYGDNEEKIAARKRKLKKNHLGQDRDYEFYIPGSSNTNELTSNKSQGASTKCLDEWEFSRNQIVVSNEQLGNGEFGQVLKATDLKDETRPYVAVKTLKKGLTNEIEKNENRKKILSEITIMKGLNPHQNVNIVRFIGCCIDKDPLYIIMEYVYYGNLLNFLRKHRKKSNCLSEEFNRDLTYHDLASFSLDIANGMNYIASKKCIHRDLAARNVLVGKDLVCKISDFSLSRYCCSGEIIYENKNENQVPMRWLALETLLEGRYSLKSDVWSFGVLLWEIVTFGVRPYPGIETGQITDKLKDGYRMPIPEQCNQKIYDMMLMCWEEDEEKRPLFSQFIKRLQTFKDNKEENLQSKIFNGHDENTNQNHGKISVSGEIK